MREPHEILGIPKDASQTTVKSAFRRLAQKWHPDKDKDNPVYHQKFQELNEAYSSLMRNKSRRKFSRDDIRNLFRKARGQSPYYQKPQATTTDGKPSSHFKEVLHQEQSKASKASKTSKVSSAQQKPDAHAPRDLSKNDIHYSVNISPQDALNGTKKRVRLFNGSWVDVTIPPCTNNGQILRLKGKGLLRKNTSIRGDLLMIVAIDFPDIYRIEGDQVFIDVPITLAEALHGAHVHIPTLAGTVLLSIPLDVNNGYTMRIKEKGMLLSDQTRGDLFAVIRIVMPPKTDESFRKMLTDWSKENPYEVREHFDHLI